MPNVVEIVLELRYRIFFAVAIGIVDLGPTGDARFHQMAKMIEWNLLLVALDALDPFRARSDQTDVAFEHVPKLREFVDSKFAQPAAQPSNARIVFTRVNARPLKLWSHQALEQLRTAAIDSIRQNHATVGSVELRQLRCDVALNNGQTFAGDCRSHAGVIVIHKLEALLIGRLPVGFVKSPRQFTAANHQKSALRR